jgi:hypothetical protein
VADLGDSGMQRRAESSRPFQVARPGPSDGENIARAYVALARSQELLRQKLPSLFLGEQRHDIFPPPERTEMPTTAQLSVEQRVVPPICPNCHTNMKWYRCKKVENNAVIDHLFSFSSCHRIAFVSTVTKVANVLPEQKQPRLKPEDRDCGSEVACSSSNHGKEASYPTMLVMSG